MSLEELIICNNSLGDKNVEILLSGILSNKTLKILDLSKNFLSNQAFYF